MMSYITFLQALRHNFCNRVERKQNGLFTRPIFPCVTKNGLGTRLTTTICLSFILKPNPPELSQIFHSESLVHIANYKKIDLIFKLLHGL